MAKKQKTFNYLRDAFHDIEILKKYSAGATLYAKRCLGRRGGSKVKGGGVSKRGYLVLAPTIMKCICHHKYQDEIYGKDFRLFNNIKASSGTAYRCTVCTLVK